MRHASCICGLGVLLLLAVGLVACSNSSSSNKNKAATHADVVLLDRYGVPMAPDSTEPYSPRKTCGFCHDVDMIANGYHFQQGRTAQKGVIIVKDDYFKDGRNYLKSAGMYGKW